MKKRYHLKKIIIISARIILSILFVITVLDFLATNITWIITNLFFGTLTKSWFGLLIDFAEILYMWTFIDYFLETTKKTDCVNNQSK